MVETTPNGWHFQIVNGGVNYYTPQGQPVTNAVFGQNNGADWSPNTIEQAASQGYNTFDSWRGDNGLPNSTGVQDNPYSSQQTVQTDAQNQALGSANPNVAPNTNLAPQNTQTTQDTSGGGGGGGFQPIMFNGQVYNDINSYSDAVNQASLDQYNKDIKTVDSLYQAGLIDIQKKEDMLKQNKQAVADRRTQLLDQFTQSNKSLGDQKTGALESQSAYFNRISPEAYQSQQQTYAGKTIDQYNQGVSNLAKQNAYNTQALNQQDTNIGNLDFANVNPNDISMTGDIGRARASLSANKQANLDAANQNKQSALDATYNNRQSSLASGTSAYSNYTAPTVTAFSDPTKGYESGVDLTSQNIAGYGGQTAQQGPAITTPMTPGQENFLNWVYDRTTGAYLPK